MPPETRKSRSTLTDRPLHNHTNTPQSNGHRRQDGYAAPSAQDRREAALLAEAAELGYRLSTQCLDCGPLAGPTRFPWLLIADPGAVPVWGLNDD
jgi:hypothetical protein